MQDRHLPFPPMISEIIAEFAQDSWIYRVTFFVCVNVGLTNNLIDDLFPIEFCLTILLYSIIFFIERTKNLYWVVVC